MNYQGTVIAESLGDPSILQDVKILTTKVEEVTGKHQTPWLQRKKQKSRQNLGKIITSETTRLKKKEGLRRRPIDNIYLALSIGGFDNENAD